VDDPRVTVVIPTYNYAEVLPNAIASVLAQTVQGFEPLVVGRWVH
jgi:glycosyltransferase involved in cell wall biosynthesis